MITVLDSVEEVLVLVDLHAPLLFLLNDVLAHLLQVVLQEFLVCHLLSEGDALAEAEQVDLQV